MIPRYEVATSFVIAPLVTVAAKQLTDIDGAHDVEERLERFHRFVRVALMHANDQVFSRCASQARLDEVVLAFYRERDALKYRHAVPDNAERRNHLRHGA